MSANLIVDIANSTVIDFVPALTNASGFSIEPQSITSTTTGQAIDLQQGDLPVQAVVAVGALNQGSVTFSFTECDTSGGTYSAIADSNATLTAISAAHTIQKVKFLRTKRFIKVVATAASSPTALVAAYVFCQAISTGTGGGYSLSPQS